VAEGVRGKAEEALQRLNGQAEAPVNEEKTRICKVLEEEFDFLG
jgi:RNA-directed DNA polymerase